MSLKNNENKCNKFEMKTYLLPNFTRFEKGSANAFCVQFLKIKLKIIILNENDLFFLNIGFIFMYVSKNAYFLMNTESINNKKIKNLKGSEYIIYNN